MTKHFSVCLVSPAILFEWKLMLCWYLFLMSWWHQIALVVDCLYSTYHMCSSFVDINEILLPWRRRNSYAILMFIGAFCICPRKQILASMCFRLILWNRNKRVCMRIPLLWGLGKISFMQPYSCMHRDYIRHSYPWDQGQCLQYRLELFCFRKV